MDFGFGNINNGAAHKQIFFDGGNLKIKFADRLRTFPALTHGLYEITQEQLEEDYLYIKSTPDYIALEFDGTVRHFILGDTARNKLQGTLRQGAGRYVKGYIGVLAVWAICNLYHMTENADVPHAPIDFYAMYPPRDRIAKNALIDAIKGEWGVHYYCGMKDFVVNIPNVKAVFEPIGGYHARILDETGLVNSEDDVYQSDTLGVDLGSYTTDMFAADRGGGIDITTATSETIGIFQVIKNIESAILMNYAKELNHIPSLKYERLEEAIRLGNLKVGRDKFLNVKEIVYQEARKLFSGIDAFVYRQGSVLSYECMLVMGGGGALLYPLFEEVYGGDVLVQSATNLNQMQYANVMGLQKMVKLLGA